MTVVGAILEHIEAAGCHSGDAAAVTPPVSISDATLSEVERIALGFRSGSEIPRWHHVCGRCGGRISVFETSCRHCGAEFDMSVPFARHLFDGSEAVA